MKWLYDGKMWDDAWELAEEIVGYDREDDFDRMLDDCEPEITICGLSLSPSEVLYKCDPVAYRCMFNDWLDGEMSEVKYELERMQPGDCDAWIYGWATVECVDEEEHEEKEEETTVTA